MNALQAMKCQLNVARTENGDVAYKSTGSACLDFFSLCGGMRRNLDDLDKLFAKAYAENPVLAIKILEDNLRRKDYTFDYSKQPSQAMLRYKKAFMRNDEERYKSFLNKVVEQAEKLARGEEIPEEERIKLNTKTLYPYQIVAPFMNSWYGARCLPDEKALPQIVFWNVEARDTHLPVTMNEKGVKLVSGASANIFADVVSGELKVVTPYEFMLQMLEPYAEFDTLVA